MTRNAQAGESVRIEIDRRLAGHTEALARQDLEAALTLYTEDAIVRPANMEPVHGHAELGPFFTSWWAAVEVESVDYTTVELDVHGSRAYQIGTYTAVQRLPGESSGVPDRGSFMVVWERQADDSWKYHRGIFNSSLPSTETITSKGASPGRWPIGVQLITLPLTA